MVKPLTVKWNLMFLFNQSYCIKSVLVCYYLGVPDLRN